MNWFYQPDIPNGNHTLTGEEFRHCVKVLRKKTADTIHLIDGKGTYYHAIIRTIQKEFCEFEIQSSSKQPTKDHHIHIAIAPTKNLDRTEWFVEKAIEIGVDAITFLKCEHSERIHVKQERIDRIAISALKQSGGATLPKFSSQPDFQAFISSTDADEKFIAFVDQNNPSHLLTAASKGKSYMVLIGPEGDFSTLELDAAISCGYTKVSLGASRLRTETAALAATHILTLLNEATSF